MKQDVLNYETDIIRRQSQNETLLERHDPHNYRYGKWNLQDFIDRFINKEDPNIKWIGNDPNANILAFFYIALVGCLNENNRNEDLFVKLKYSLYQESKEILSMSQQKVFVEHLCLLQYSKDIGEFLKKSSHLESILLKILSIKRKQSNKKKNPNQKIDNKIYEIQKFSLIFPFLKLQILDTHCARILINDQTYYIIEQKQCFFVVEPSPFSLITGKISGVGNYHHHKFKSSPSITKIHSLDSLDNFNLMESKYESSQDNEKCKVTTLPEESNLKSKDSSSLNSKKQSSVENKTLNFYDIINIEQPEQITRERKKSFNILDCIKEIEQSLQNQIKDSTQKLRDTRQNIRIQSLRSSLEKGKSLSKQKDHILHFKKYTSIPQMKESQFEQSETETVRKGEDNKKLKYVRSQTQFNRNIDFIHMSLGSRDMIEGQKIVQGIINNQSNKKGAPKFLVSKKNVEKISPNLSANNTPSKYGGQVRKQQTELLKRDYDDVCVPLLKPFTGMFPTGVEVTSRVTPISSPRNQKWQGNSGIRKMYPGARGSKKQ